ncbi:MAG: isoprenyl transferase [Actinomycetaceae bacterium]|nr:isoprenyl transferase [Actinomycetaceae bacterium]
MSVNHTLLYRLYERRLMNQLKKQVVPKHIGVILDGNRRWAKAVGAEASQGHREGADKVHEFLDWAEDAGVDIVTLWMLSTDNLKRSSDEIRKLLDIIVNAVSELASTKRWKLRLVGATDLLPEKIATQLHKAVASTDNIEGMNVNIAVGYGGREEITEAIKQFLRQRAHMGESLDDVAKNLHVDDITDNLYTRGQPDPDLVIRTSGEQRLSGFLLWQSAHSEYYFCEAYWPDFRRIDFLRAMRAYSQRERRMGR